MQSEKFRVGERVRDAGGREGMVVEIGGHIGTTAPYCVHWDDGDEPRWFDGQPVARVQAPAATTSAEPPEPDVPEWQDVVRANTPVVATSRTWTEDGIHYFQLIWRGNADRPWRFHEEWLQLGDHGAAQVRSWLTYSAEQHLGLLDPYAPTIDSTCAAVLPVPETPFEPDAIWKDRWHCAACLTPNEGVEARCWHCGHNSNNDILLGRERVSEPDLSLTNEVGFPTMPTMVLTQAAYDDLVGDLREPDPNAPRIGDVVEWSGRNGAPTRGVVIQTDPVSRKPPEPGHLFARHWVEGETTFTVVAVERCTVVQKRESL